MKGMSDLLYSASARLGRTYNCKNEKDFLDRSKDAGVGHVIIRPVVKDINRYHTVKIFLESSVDPSRKPILRYETEMCDPTKSKDLPEERLLRLYWEDYAAISIDCVSDIERRLKVALGGGVLVHKPSYDQVA